MLHVVVPLVGVLGLLVGSFLNVVIWRVPRGESVVHPGSHCPRCGRPIRPFENIPVVSWLALRGRCRGCSEPISMRYPLVEAGTALLFVGVVVWRGLETDLPAFLYLAAVGIALALIDLDCHRLPDAIVLPSLAVSAALLTGAAAASGQWAALGRSGLAAVALFAFYFALAVVYPAGMGFGDVKLAALVGLYLGWIGWGAVIVGGFAAFLLGGVFAIGLLVLRRAGRRTRVPFGPWIFIGTTVGLVAGPALWETYLQLLV